MAESEKKDNKSKAKGEKKDVKKQEPKESDSTWWWRAHEAKLTTESKAILVGKPGKDCTAMIRAPGVDGEQADQETPFKTVFESFTCDML